MTFSRNKKGKAISDPAFAQAHASQPWLGEFYLLSNRTKYTLSLKICSGTSSLAQFMIE